MLSLSAAALADAAFLVGGDLGISEALFALARDAAVGAYNPELAEGVFGRVLGGAEGVFGRALFPVRDGVRGGLAVAEEPVCCGWRGRWDDGGGERTDVRGGAFVAVAAGLASGALLDLTGVLEVDGAVLGLPLVAGFFSAGLAAGAVVFCGGDTGKGTDGGDPLRISGLLGGERTAFTDAGGDVDSLTVDFGGHSLFSLISAIAESPVFCD